MPVEKALFRTLYDGKIMEGRDGWYFLSNDTNHVVDQLCGRLPLSESEVKAWRRRLECRTAWLARMDIPYVFLVAPNPHSLYPEKLPEGVVPSRERPALQVVRHVRESGSLARIVYPQEEIVAARAQRPVASPNDTHWGPYAAFVAYGLLLDQIDQQVVLRRLTEDRVEWAERGRMGDLGSKLDPAVSAPQVTARVLERGARVRSDNQVQNRGRLVEMECSLAPPTTCIVMGDSFTYELLPFLAESFGRTIYAQVPTFDYELADEVRPDVVVGLMNERFLRSPFREFSSPTTRELAAEKTRQGLSDAPHLDLLFEQPLGTGSTSS